MSDKVSIHIDGAQQDPGLPDTCPAVCPTCGTDAEMGFGLAGGGYGAYSYCPNCEKMLGKVQVED